MHAFFVPVRPFHSLQRCWELLVALSPFPPPPPPPIVNSKEAIEQTNLHTA